MKIIGISGKAGSGKTTLTGHLLDLLGDGWKRTGFADVLKAETAERFNFPLEWCYSSKDTLIDITDKNAPCYKMSVRRLLQWWGTDVRRKSHQDYWCEKMAESLNTLRASELKGVIIDDIRFENEADLVLNQDGLLIRVETYDGYKFVTGEESAHISETALDDYHGWSYTITPEFGQLEEAADSLHELL